MAPSAPLPIPEPSLLPVIPIPAELPPSPAMTQGPPIEQQQSPVTTGYTQEPL